MHIETSGNLDDVYVETVCYARLNERIQFYGQVQSKVKSRALPCDQGLGFASGEYCRVRVERALLLIPRTLNRDPIDGEGGRKRKKDRKREREDPIREKRDGKGREAGEEGGKGKKRTKRKGR